MAIYHQDGKLCLTVLVLVYNNPDHPFPAPFDPHVLSQSLANDIEKASRTDPADPNSTRLRISLVTQQIEGTPPQLPPPYSGADYNAIIDDNGLAERIGYTPNGEIDEVWMWGDGTPAGGGFYESRVVGPNPWECNSPPIIRNDMRNCVFMGFNYERGETEELESFCHRVERTISKVYGDQPWGPETSPVSDWAKFVAFLGRTTYNDGTPAGADSGHPAGVGNAHFGPGTLAICEYHGRDDPRTVWTRAPALRDPNLPLDNPAYWEQINDNYDADNTVWNTGAYPRADDPTLHEANFLVWWLYHLPKFDGSYVATQGDGTQVSRLKNWWEYIFNFNNPLGTAYEVLQSGQAQAAGAVEDAEIVGIDTASYVAAFFTSDGGYDDGLMWTVTNNPATGSKDIHRTYWAFDNSGNTYPFPSGEAEQGRVLVATSIEFHFNCYSVTLETYPFTPCLMSFWDHLWATPPLDPANREANWDQLGGRRLAYQALGEWEPATGWQNVGLVMGESLALQRATLRLGAKLAQTDQPEEWPENFRAEVHAYGAGRSDDPYLVINWELRRYWG